MKGVIGKVGYKIEWKEEATPRYEGLTPCWNCISHKPDYYGYPQFFRHHEDTRVYRYLYYELFGQLPKGKVIRHKCDNPLCINPEHLIEGTYQDNTNDRDSRGRGAFGERHPRCKIKEDDVRFIRKNGFPRSHKKHKELSALFNVSIRNIRSILDGETWKNVAT